MPAYINTPFKPTPRLLVSGTPEYVWGSKNSQLADCVGYVIANSSSAGTQTLVFQIVSGNSPIVSATLYQLLANITGTANNSGKFNATNVAVLTATTTSSGICTITYASGNSFSQASLPDGGSVVIPVVEVGETFANGASMAVATPFNNPNVQQGRTINATVTFPVPTQQPTAGTVYLQGAIIDRDSEYEDIGAIITIGSPTSGGPTLEIVDSAYRFYRLLNVGVLGGGTVVGKITC